MSSAGKKKQGQKRKAPSSGDLEKDFQEDREKAAESIMGFRFIKRRVRVLTQAQLVKDKCSGIVYWMSRDARVQDNWAMLFAQKLAMKNKVSLHVVFCLLPTFLDATLRHYKFLLGGLQEVSDECGKLSIPFHILRGRTSLVDFVREHNMGGVVCDFSPLDFSRKWVQDVNEALPEDIPLCQVDAHNVIPVWVTSDKVEFSARTIRKKVHNNLEEFLTPFPPVIPHPYPGDPPEKISWSGLYKYLKVDKTVDAVAWAAPGYKAGVKMLKEFVDERLKHYGDKRNDVVANVQSNLSPWFHFGHISVQRCILYVEQFRKQHPESVAAFCEEAIVRRELSDNYCFYSEHQSSFEGLHIWARTTLDAHRKDKREYLYTREQFDEAQTHDDLWNAAQIQMKVEGKMHGFMRMYWAKKILEWTTSPEEAISIALYLNDRYNLDGRDANGIVGVLWSIGGLHDKPFFNRNVFGKIRFMALSGCKKKFKVDEYIKSYCGEESDSDSEPEAEVVEKKKRKK